MHVQALKTALSRNRADIRMLLPAPPFALQQREERIIGVIAELVERALSEHALFLEPEALDQLDRTLVAGHDEDLNPIQLHLPEAEIDDRFHSLGHDALAPASSVEVIPHLSLIVGGWRPFIEAYRANRLSMALERDHPAKAQPLLIQIN